MEANNNSSNIPAEEVKEDKPQEEKKEKKEVLVNNLKAEGGAYKGSPKHDYCLQFVKTGERPQQHDAMALSVLSQNGVTLNMIPNDKEAVVNAICF